MALQTIAICCSQVPFFRDGAELAVDSLRRQLERRGYEATIVWMPFRWSPKSVLPDQCLAWRSLDLTESNGKDIDLVIATKFPSYAVKHPRKVTWLFHQFRQVYDLFGTRYSEYTRCPDDLAVREMIRRVDCRTLSESRHIYTLSKTVSKRLSDFNDLESTPLYHPPPNHESFRPGPYESYVLSVGRLDAMKRVAPLVAAMAKTDPGLRCVIAGEGPELSNLRRLAESLEVDDRVEFPGAIGFEDLVKLYSKCLAVYFAPFNEDYGFITLEAFLSEKPVITAPDSGGALEFVTDGETGIVSELEPEKLGERLRWLHGHRNETEAMGRKGHGVASAIEWDPVVDALVQV